MKKILIVAATHGHEHIGIRVHEALRTLSVPDDQVELLIGNPEAYAKNIPFTESDLNRVFPGDAERSFEERRAAELLEKIKTADVVIDIHSTKTTDLSDNSMVIVTKLSPETKELLHVFQPPKVLYMKYKGDRALISNAKIGIAFEYGLDTSEAVLAATIHDIAALLVHLGVVASNPFPNPRELTQAKIFEVYDAFQKEFDGSYTLSQKLENFVQVLVGEEVCTSESGEVITAPEDFYPILFGNNRYTDILGFKARLV